MSDNFKSLSEIIGKEKEFSNFRTSVKENNVINDFYNIFPALEKNVKTSNIYKSILYLIVENSVLRNELNLKKKIMIEKINKHYNQKIITDIKFTYSKNSYRKF
ncbi:MAG: hypothetical protein CR986_08565 [Ignavibacteriae bacterium]|nr:MAG: hypothetical protein CR986_08565 [Ignavibacteriota bacterium]